MLTLLTFPGALGMPSHSPFCIKAMCLLQMSGQDWQPSYVSNPSKMPHGRLPVLKTNDRLIADSHHIQAHLESLGTDFDAGLSTTAKAQSHALVRMVEENLRCGLVHDRWLRDDCWPFYRDLFFASAPTLIRKPLANSIRKKVRLAMMSHGIAQFSETQRLDRLGRDLGAIDVTLGDKPFLFGNTPTAADAAIAPVLEMIRTLACDTDLRQIMRDNTTLCSYTARCRDAIFPA